MGIDLKFELGWELEPLLECERWLLRTGISQFCEAGQVETDNWPLALARPWGLATVLSVRRGRVSFDGNKQIAN